MSGERSASGGRRAQSLDVALLSGTAAGVANVLAGHPLDTLKVWAQTRRAGPVLGGTWSLRMLYRGLGPPLLTVPTLTSLNFTVYEEARDVLWRFFPQMSPALCAFLAGLSSGYALCHVTNPMNVVKVQQQTSAASKSDPMLTVARRIVRSRGWLGLFQGYVPHAAMEGLGRATYMATYAAAKSFCGLGDARGSRGGQGAAADASSLGARILCGSLAGMVTWTVAYPFDVVRNNLMRMPSSPDAERVGALECARRILRSDGPRGFYRGFGFTLVRAGPVAAMTLTTYDMAGIFFGRHLG